MDESATLQENSTSEEVQNPADGTPEAPKEKTEAEKKAEAEEADKKTKEADANELKQIEIDVHGLYNLAQHSGDFSRDPKFHMGRYIRVIAYLDKLGNPSLPPEQTPVQEVPKDRAAKRRDQRDIDKGTKQAEKVKKQLDNGNKKQKLIQKGTKKGKKISAKKLAAAAKKPGKLGR